MSEQMYRIDNKAVPLDDMVVAGKLLVVLIQANVLVPVEPDIEAARQHLEWMNGVVRLTLAQMAEVVGAALDGAADE